MLTQQYVQHDWPPAVFALMLLALAALVVVGMLMFLVGANRELKGFTARHAGQDAGHPRRHGRTAPPAHP